MALCRSIYHSKVCEITLRTEVCKYGRKELVQADKNIKAGLVRPGSEGRTRLLSYHTINFLSYEASLAML